MEASTLESVLATRELSSRARRPPNHEAENRALVSLAQHLATSPRDILQRLAEAALQLCDGDSAGLSLVEEEADGQLIFRWPVIAGAFAENVRGTTPRDFSPCGVVLDTNEAQLFRHPAEHYPYLHAASPPIVEALLQPFSFEGRPIGTIWVISHDDRRKFDSEDARALKSLATFAASAYQVLFALQTVGEADQQKGEFLAVLSHEMRTPLQVVLTWAKVLAGTPAADETERRGRAAIERNAIVMARMMDDLLDVSRIAAGKLSIEPTDTDLAAIVRHCVDGIAISAVERGVAVETALDEAIPLRADPTRIQQIVGNLLSNALKFTPSGGTISVRASQIGGNAELVVRDSGEGISVGALPSIFERFQQGDASTRGGLGIGLTVARHLTELHGGTIEAQSDGPGHGATFRVRLPVG